MKSVKQVDSKSLDAIKLEILFVENAKRSFEVYLVASTDSDLSAKIRDYVKKLDDTKKSYVSLLTSLREQLVKALENSKEAKELMNKLMQNSLKSHK